MRTCHNFKHPKEKRIGNFLPIEKREAMTYLIQQDQARSFGKEIEAAKANKKRNSGKISDNLG